ncbi:MAG: Gluconeogenesis factor [Firmicutes bacterium]|nr:Gluconeogenesis factor [Bacillota bacterium]
MRFWKWLYPGLCIKRWVFLALLGLFFFVMGLGLLWGREIVSYVESKFLLFLGLIYGGPPPMFWGFSLMAVGLIFVLIAIRSIMVTILHTLAPEHDNRLIDVLFARRLRQSGPRMVAIGGGTGLAVLLRGLKQYTSNITAVVTVADDGGSSGRLRSDLGVLPPGDIRNCVLALADTEPLLEQLFQYRFAEGELAGHSFGNLLIVAMTNITGDFKVAVKEFGKVLAVKGQVLPVTDSPVQLHALLKDGSRVVGETKVGQCNGQIVDMFLEPAEALPLPEVLRAIREADAIILGPGSLYTSVIPNLLVKGVSQALLETQAIIIYVCNIMTQPGETTGLTAADHVATIHKFVGGKIVDYIVVNVEHIKPELAAKYREAQSLPVTIDHSRLQQIGVKVVTGELLEGGSLLHHDSKKLARRLMRAVIMRTLTAKRRSR